MALNQANSMAGMSRRRAIGAFATRRDAEAALHELNDSGFPMEHVSVITKDHDRNQEIAGADVRDTSGNQADKGAKTGALSGGALGGLTGLLVGLGALAIPGVGPVMLAGAAATALATTAAGGAIGAAAGGLLGGLIGLGIPEEEARGYNNRVSAGEYLVLVDGTDEAIARAESIFKRRGVQDWRVYDIPGDTQGVAVQPVKSTPMTTGTMTDRMTPATVSDRTATSSVPASEGESVRLYEERLVVDKDREKVGEVTLGKHVEVETVQTSVPIERESVVIERVPSGSSAVTPDSDAFQQGEVIRTELYEEVPDIRKEAFVREEVSIRKEVVQETVNAEERLRKEKLDIDKQGQPIVDSNRNPKRDPSK